MAPPLLDLQNIALSFGGNPLLADASLSVTKGGRIALVGRNGSGKSTLLKIAAGMIEQDGGVRFVQPGATLRYLPQEPDLGGFETISDYVTSGLGPGQDPYRGAYLLEQLGLSGKEAVKNLSGGEARRAALARVLAPQPDILLLDEPTNHLDLPAIEWLETELQSLKCALVLISHDRAFLNSLSRQTIWLDHGQTRQLNRGFEHFEEWRDNVLEEEASAQHKLDRKLVAEEHWLRYGVTARRKRNVRRLGQLHELRKQRDTGRITRADMQISVATGKKTGVIIVDAKALGKTLGGRPLVKDLTLRVLRNDRLAIVGPNGVGKTTLIRLLTGQLAPDTGELRLGGTIELAFLDQTRMALDPQTTLKDALTGGGRDMVLINNVQKHVIAYMKDFLFTPDQLMTPLQALSGGERARVMLARALALPSNFLVLDEPTNDLDLETLDLLQETISNYHGTVILVSHDRDFIDRIATMTLIAEGDGHWTSYAGGYQDMVALRGHGVRVPDGVQSAGGAGAQKKSASRKSALAPAPPKKRKLSFKQQHALKTLPENMAALEEQMAEINQRMADAQYYQRDPAGFSADSDALARKQAQYDQFEEEWLELEILREEMEKN